MRRLVLVVAVLAGGGCQAILGIGDTVPANRADAAVGDGVDSGPGATDAAVPDVLTTGVQDAPIDPGSRDAAPGTPDAAPGAPDAAPGTPDAAPGTPDAAVGPIDASPSNRPDAAPGPSGTIDTSFNGGAVINAPFGTDNYATYGLVVRPDGRVAYFLSGNHSALDDEGVEQMNEDGSPDTGFGVNGFVTLPQFQAFSMALDASGRLILGGNDGRHGMIVGLDAQGRHDPTFGPAGGDDTGQAHDLRGQTVAALAVQPDRGVIYALSDSSGDRAARLCRLTAGGVTDTGFGNAGCWNATTSNADLWGVATDASGAIFAGGSQGDFDTKSAFAVFLSATGTDPHEIAYPKLTDTQFWPGGVATSSGRVVIVGYQSAAHDLAAITRADSGGPDLGFGGGGTSLLDLGDVHNSQFDAVAVQADGKLVAVGMTLVDGDYRGVVVRFRTNGTKDADFANGGVFIDPASEHLRNVAIAPDGRIVVAGNTATLRGYVARLWP